MNNPMELIIVMISACSAIGALGAAAFAAYQTHLTRFSLGVDLISKLDERFEGEEFRKKRKAAADAISRNVAPDAEDVLDFFETLGLLTRRGALDKEMVWSTFFYWIHGYQRLCENYVREQRKSFPARYGDLLWLHLGDGLS